MQPPEWLEMRWGTCALSSLLLPFEGSRGASFYQGCVHFGHQLLLISWVDCCHFIVSNWALGNYRNYIECMFLFSGCLLTPHEGFLFGCFRTMASQEAHDKFSELRVVYIPLSCGLGKGSNQNINSWWPHIRKRFNTNMNWVILHIQCG